MGSDSGDNEWINDGDHDPRKDKKCMLEAAGRYTPRVGNTDLPGVGIHDWENITKYEPTNRRQGTAQDVHFSTRALILGHQIVVSNFSQPIFIKFHTEIAYETLQYLNFVIGQKN